MAYLSVESSLILFFETATQDRKHHIDQRFLFEAITSRER